jgi:hypothetical protein
MVGGVVNGGDISCGSPKKHLIRSRHVFHYRSALAQQMDDDGNYPQDSPNTYVPKTTLQHIKAQMNNIENKRKQGLTAIDKYRKKVIMELNNRQDTMTRLEDKQRKIAKSANIIAIGAVSLILLKVASAGFAFIPLLLQRWKARKKEAQLKGSADQMPKTDEEREETESLRERDYNLVPRRLHSRQWQISES